MTPEKIWATAEGLIAGPWRTPGEGDPLVETPYTRTDISEAEKRAEYQRGLEDAAKVVEEYARADRGVNSWSRVGRYMAAAIRALAKED